MGRKYFTSDWHLGHKRFVEKFGSRPFSSTEEMDDTIIENMFTGKRKGDMIYFLGDLYFDIASFEKMYNQIPNGVRFFWVLGNHDEKLFMKHIKQFEKIIPMMETKIQGNHVVLCHYPMQTWNRSHYNSWQLFGHHHIGGHFEPGSERLGKQLNVNLEYHDFKPWTEDEVVEYMEGRPDNFDLIQR